MLDQIRIVLISTSHPGNIGAAARAMKTMGLEHLYLVNPVYFPDRKADEMATGATDILKRAKVVTTLTEAIADCTLVVGTSARMRTIPWSLHTPRELAEKVQQETKQSKIAILFGCETFGLTNEELQQCHFHVSIPTNPSFSSLNIAAAVQIIAYELRLASGQDNHNEENEHRLANMLEMEKYFEHLEKILVQIGFLKMSSPRKLMARLRRIFFRTRLDINEINMLRGILTAIEETRDKTMDDKTVAFLKAHQQ